MTPAVNGVLVALALLAVVAYLRWGLPQLARSTAAATTTVLAFLGVVGGLGLGPAWWLPAVAVAFGHLGWTLAGRSLRTKAASAPNPAPAPLADRATLGRYRIVRELGRGAMGAVYLGHDPQQGRAVAIKTLALRREFDADTLADARTRFLREADAARRLQHPNIVALFESGEEDGLAYLAMEFLPGRDLAAHTRAGALLPIPTVLHTVACVAQALAHAHERGVVHRDVKPANVMLDLPTSSVKVTDFGIATLGDALRTRTGVLLGTPAYMSPEQLSGRRVDGRSDLYSLGVLLFELLTGALPHRAESMGELMQQIGQQAAPDVRSLRPELPGAVADIVALALQKRPEMRYADGHQMAEDLALVSGQLEGGTPPARAGDNFGPSRGL